MNQKKAIRGALLVVGVLSLVGWMGVGDTLAGQMMFATSIGIALVLHGIQPKQEVVPQAVPVAVPVAAVPQKTPEEIELEKLQKRVAELQKQPQPVQQKPKTAPISCQFCEKVCRNETDFKRHIAFKHLDKIKLEVKD